MTIEQVLSSLEGKTTTTTILSSEEAKLVYESDKEIAKLVNDAINIIFSTPKYFKPILRLLLMGVDTMKIADEVCRIIVTLALQRI